MVAYSFKPEFAGRILDGTKDQTIRAPRANGHVEPGKPLHLYVGMRTKHCRLILKTTCLEVLPIRLVFWPVVEIEISGEKLPPDDLAPFAIRDGFRSVAAMAAFWAETHGCSRREFSGFVIRWPRVIPEIGRP